MRASVILVVVFGLFACSHAADLSGLTDTLKDVGANLVNNLVSSAKDKLVELGKSVLGSLLEKFGVGKRELLSHLGKFGDMLTAGKDKATVLFKNAMDKLKALKEKFYAKFGLMKDAKEVKDAVDDVVAEHHVQHKRVVNELIQTGQNLLGSIFEGLHTILSGVHSTASDVLKHGASTLLGKRTTLSEHLSNIGGAISSAVSPFKDIVAGLGNTLKGHFSNLVDTVKGHVTALQGKLSGHVDDLKTHGSTLLQHGKNALGALGEAVTDILKQTLTNAGPAIDGLAKTASDAGSTILNHLATSGSSST